MTDRSIRTWIWVSLAAQAFGYVVDAVWHGWISPEVEPATVEEMVRHLAGGTALAAFAGALLPAGSEAWHAASHLRLDTQHAPVAGTLSFVGFLVAVVAMSPSRRSRRRVGTRD